MPAHPSVLLLGINVTEKQGAIVVVVSGVVMWATRRVVQAVREQSGMSTPTPHEACVSRRCPLLVDQLGQGDGVVAFRALTAHTKGSAEI
jgi:hypothetical protein